MPGPVAMPAQLPAVQSSTPSAPSGGRELPLPNADLLNGRFRALMQKPAAPTAPATPAGSSLAPSPRRPEGPSFSSAVSRGLSAVASADRNLDQALARARRGG